MPKHNSSSWILVFVSFLVFVSPFFPFFRSKKGDMLVKIVKAQEASESSKSAVDFKTTKVSSVTSPSLWPRLPITIKLALALYSLSFVSLVSALVIWYRQNQGDDDLR